MKHKSHVGIEKFYQMSSVLQWGEMNNHIRAVAACYACQVYSPSRGVEAKKLLPRDHSSISDKTVFFLDYSHFP